MEKSKVAKKVPKKQWIPKKKGKKRGSKKGAKKTPENIVIPIVNLMKGSKGGDNIRISGHSISFTPAHAKKIGFDRGHYLLIGVLGSKVYIGKKPKGVFGGHLVLHTDADKSIRLSIKSKFQEDYGILPGNYTLGDEPIPQTVAAMDGEQVPFEFWELVLV